jgi:hypothetical protein
LLTVARRQLSRYFRRAKVERRAIERLGISVPMIHEEDVAEIERRAGLVELRAALRVELARLSEQQRDALRLRIVEERPYPEVAAERADDRGEGFEGRGIALRPDLGTRDQRRALSTEPQRLEIGLACRRAIDRPEGAVWAAVAARPMSRA